MNMGMEAYDMQVQFHCLPAPTDSADRTPNHQLPVEGRAAEAGYR